MSCLERADCARRLYTLYVLFLLFRTGPALVQILILSPKGVTFMDDNYIKNNLETIFKRFQDMIKVETVVGEAVHIGDAILVPFVDISFGFGSGSTDGKGDASRQSVGGGGGAKLEPTAILVIKGDRVEMFSIKKDGYHASGFEKLSHIDPAYRCTFP